MYHATGVRNSGCYDSAPLVNVPLKAQDPEQNMALQGLSKVQAP